MTHTHLLAGLAITTCVCSWPADNVRSDDRARSREGSPGHCDLAPDEACAATGLPRITDREWNKDEVALLLQRVQRGTVAVAWDGTHARLIADCALDGQYVEVKGERLGGRFWATNRVLFDLGEVPPACAEATHEVAAFVYRATPPVRFSAILVPLPCPPTDAQAPAAGCLGRGLAGAERRGRAQAIFQARVLDGKPVEASTVFEIYALAPDRNEWLAASNRVTGRRSGDCGLGGQIGWLSSHYRRAVDTRGDWQLQRSPSPRALPTLHPTHSRDHCEYRPAFLTCFPGLFDPAPDTMGGCWAPVAAGRAP